jgi:hypothetical protein
MKDANGSVRLGISLDKYTNLILVRLARKYDGNVSMAMRHLLREADERQQAEQKAAQGSREV